MSGSTLPNITYAAIDTPLYGTGSGGGVGSTINTSSISTVFLDVRSGNVGLGGGEYISTIGNQLFFFNGTVLEPISAISSISSIEEWSIYPAISTVNLAGEDIIGGNIIESGLVSTMMIDTDYLSAQQAFVSTLQNVNINSVLISTVALNAQNISAQQAFVSDLQAYNIVAENFTALSTIQTFNYVSSLIVDAQDIQTSSITTNALIANQSVSTPAAFLSSINGQSIGSIITGDTSNWATFSANSTINCAGNPIFSGSGATTDLTLNGTRYLNANATGVFITADEPLNPAAFTDISLTTGGGNRGRVQLTANPGLTGINGEINLVANGGSDSGIILGGVVNITANTPLGPSPTASSAIKLNAASIVSYAGAIPPIGSLVGFNYLYGSLGVNVTAGLPSVLPNIPGTFYGYGVSGVTLESGFGSDVEVKDSDFAALSIRPRTSILVNFGDLNITGRINLVAPNQYVNMSNVKRIDFENGELAAINNLSTLNGQPISFYAPTAPISTFTELFTSTFNTSSINGQPISFYEPTPPISSFNQLFTSSFNTSTITAEGQIFINPSTTSSGLYLPFDAVNGTGVVAIGLSTTSIFNQYSALLAGIGTPYNSTGTEMITALQTKDNQTSFQFAPVNLGTVLFNGEVNYGTNPAGYITGDTAGNLYAGAAKFETSSIVCSTVTVGVSTILNGSLTGSVLEVLESATPGAYGQVEAQAYTMAATTVGPNGTLYYRDLEDRAGFIDNNGSSFTLAYTTDSNYGVDTLEVSTINMNGSGFINWDGGVSMYETGPNALFITNGAGTTLDITPTGFVFTEAGSGTNMTFENSVLTVPNISTNNIQALTGILTSSLTVSTINGLPPLLDGSVGNLSSFGVSSMVAGFADIGDMFVQNIASSDPLASGISGFSSLQVESGTISTLTVSTINSQPYIGFRGGQFYRSVNQNLPTGNNNLIFDTAKPWNSADFIQTDPSTFLCSTTGTYQIGINNTVAAATGTWSALNKGIFIQQDRGGAQNVVVNTTSVPNASAYGQSASALIDIDQGDFLRFLTGQTLTGGSTISLGVSSIIDYNTFWDYQLLRTG
jgi:hypothetical protein